MRASSFHIHLFKPTCLKNLIHILLIAVVLTSCSSRRGSFRLEGEFRNMNQAELYIYDAVKGQKDTISVNRGRFIYERAVADTSTLMMIFPNYSTIPIFAYSGVKIKLKGDASQLKKAELKGSDENEDMTAFRLKTSQMTPPEVKKEATEFIENNPESYVSLYLLNHYFIESVSPDYDEAYRLSKLMLKANPTRRQLVQLHKRIKALHAGAVGSKLPVFAVLDINNNIITTNHLHKKVNVVCLWANWSYDSRNALSQLNRLQKKYPEKLSVMGISIDATKDESKDWRRRDSISCPIICDGKMWDTPLATSMGLNNISSNIIADKNGKIIKRDIPKSYDLKKEVEKLLEE